MSIQRIRNILKESLFGNQPKVGFMEYDWGEIADEQIDEVYENLKDQLRSVNVDVSKMNIDKESRKLIIVVTSDKEDAVADVFNFFKIPCIKSVFDPKAETEKAQHNYPEPSPVQDSNRVVY